MKKILLSSFLFLFIAFFYLGFRILSWESEDGVAAQGVGFEQCSGRVLAEYMNAVIEGTRGAERVLLLSPAFNLTDPAEGLIFEAMRNNGANFGGLAGFSGNTYSNIPGSTVSAYGHYQNEWANRFSSFGKGVVFTEFGDFDTKQFPLGSPLRGELIERMVAEYARTSADSSVLGINYFNPLGTNPDPEFEFHMHTVDELTRIAGSNPLKLGINSASVVNKSFAEDAAAAGARWSVEIVNSPGDLEGAIEAVNAAIDSGINPVIRFCSRGGCGFSDDPQEMVQFVNDLNRGVNGNVWVVAGPNEPATEHWAAPQCTSSSIFVNNTDFVQTPCHLTEENEFNSLRPYGGEVSSPCNPNLDEIALLCGNDLIARKNYVVTPGEALACQTLPDGTQRCQYSIPTNVDIRIDLSESELPIVGNTELVPNVLSNIDELSPSTRVNEYVSWYLNGVNNRAEDEYLSYNGPRDVSEKITDVDNARDINRVINFSGPLNKLLPWDGLIRRRMSVVVDAFRTKNSLAFEPNIRHDQIVGCTIGFDINPLGDGPSLKVGTPIPCYNQTSILGFGVPTLKHRLTDWMAHLPPVEEEGGDFGDYWLSYREWRGDECKSVSALGARFFLCGGDFGVDDPFKLDFWSNLFANIPLSNSSATVAPNLRGSTEDRKGFVSIAEPAAVPRAEGNEVEIIDLIWTSESTSDLLYFSHMQENDGLADLLQDTYTPIDQRGGKVTNNVPTFSVPSSCEIVNAKTNPGDDLLGEQNFIQPAEADISGTMSFTAEFECDFTPEVPRDGAPLLEQCVTDPAPAGIDPILITTIGKREACRVSLTTFPTQCTKVGMTAQRVTVGAPKAKDIWDRLVAGPMGIFKRVYPKIGRGAPVEALEPIPGETGANYLASSNDGLAGAQAGSPVLGRGGESAKLFIPFIGGYEEYFLEGIQKALRPKNNGIESGSGRRAERDVEINCIQGLPDSAVPATGARYLDPLFRDNVFRIADDWLGTTTHFARECYNDVIIRSLNAGVDPALTLAFWLHESDASNYAQLSSDIQDFGINLPSIARNFDKQIERYLNIAVNYRSIDSYSNCIEDSSGFSDMEIFMMVYKNGPAGCGGWVRSLPETYDDKVSFLQGIFGPLAGEQEGRVWQFLNCGGMPSSPTEFACFN